MALFGHVSHSLFHGESTSKSGFFYWVRIFERNGPDLVRIFQKIGPDLVWILIFLVWNLNWRHWVWDRVYEIAWAHSFYAWRMENSSWKLKGSRFQISWPKSKNLDFLIAEWLVQCWFNWAIWCDLFVLICLSSSHQK